MTFTAWSVAISLVLLCAISSEVHAQAPTVASTTATPAPVRLVTREDVKLLWLNTSSKGKSQNCLHGRSSFGTRRANRTATSTRSGRPNFPGFNATQREKHREDQIRYAQELLEPIRKVILSGEAD